jgi:excisionase family DNA binding protein
MQKDQQTLAPLQYTTQQLMQALGMGERSNSMSEANKINATQNGRGNYEGGEVIRLLAKSIAEELLDASEALLDTNEMAKHLKVSVSTVERMSRDGRIPKVKIGDLNRYSPSKVLKALTISQLGELQ